MSYSLISSILRGAWLIDPSYAAGHMNLVSQFLKGSVDSTVFRSGNGDYEMPFVVTPTGERLPAFASSTKLNPDIPSSSVFVMPVSGVILKSNGDCGEPGMQLRESWLHLAEANPNINTILLLIDSPGGQAYGTFSFAEALRNSPKKTISYVDSGMAASAAFWIASACDEFYCGRDVDKVGSCGVLTTLVDPTGMYEKEGLKIKTVYAPESSEKNADYRAAFDADSPDTTQIEADLSVLAQKFIGSIKEYRGTKLKSDAFSKGRMFFATEALTEGLIDGIKPLSEILNTHSKKNSKMSKKNQYPSMAKTLSWPDNYETTDSGVHLQHEEAGLIEQQLTDYATLQQEVSQLKSQNADLTTKLNDATSQVAEKEQTISDLKSGPANEGTPPGKVTHDKASGEEMAPEPELDSVTLQARQMRAQWSKK